MKKRKKRKIIRKKKSFKKIKKTKIKKKSKIKKKIKSKKFKKRYLKPLRKIITKKKQFKIKYSSKNLIVKFVRLQEKLKPDFKFKFSFSLEKAIQGFFQKIADKIEEYKFIKEEEKRKRQIKETEIMEKEKIAAEREFKLQEKLKLQEKKKELKEEMKLEKERAKDIKLFLRKEQAIIRKEQSDKQRQFLEELKIEKQIDKFRIREIKELESLEKISLKEQREDYAGLQERISKLKEKYRIIRDQKIRERIESLGVQVEEGDDREALLQKERQYLIERQKIENCLESFYRSASSLVFQLNKRHITRHMSIFRCVDRRFETGEIFIKWDEAIDEEWLLLIYIKDNSPDEGIIIEDKSNPEKNITHELKTSEIFKASDLMVDSLTQLLAREREKNKKN
tara:strand:+ start:2780 stop:3967 length:1188 start_codon:yes stop_codon:yes gene_type:complete